MAAGLLVVAVTAGCKTVVITPSGGYSPTAASLQSHTPQRAEAHPARTPTQAPPKRPRLPLPLARREVSVPSLPPLLPRVWGLR
ncbi:hypothetical protein ADK76_05640, partial [Streptomyces griseoflavus]